MHPFASSDARDSISQRGGSRSLVGVARTDRRHVIRRHKARGPLRHSRRPRRGCRLRCEVSGDRGRTRSSHPPVEARKRIQLRGSQTQVDWSGGVTGFIGPTTVPFTLRATGWLMMAFPCLASIPEMFSRTGRAPGKERLKCSTDQRSNRHRCFELDVKRIPGASGRCQGIRGT